MVDGKLPPSPLKNIGRGIDLVKMSEEDIISLIYEAINRRLLRLITLLRNRSKRAGKAQGSPHLLL